MTKEDKFISLVHDLNEFSQKEKELYTQKLQTREVHFLYLSEHLQTLYIIEQKRLNDKYIKPFKEKNSFLFGKSVLRIINRCHWETYHSLLLKYFWENPILLKSFISRVDGIECKEQILQLLSNNDYSIKEEYKIKNIETDKIERKIDLLITDNKKNWLITIENKIHSEVSKDAGGQNTQLDDYHKYLEYDSRYQSFKYKIYILLSHRNNRKYINGKDWKYVDYYEVFASLLENNTPGDSILTDYLKTLYFLLFGDRDINGVLSIHSARKFYIEVQSKIK